MKFNEKLINLIDAIDNIDNFEDYKVIFNAICNHKFKRQLLSGIQVDKMPTKEDIDRFILESIYDRTGDSRVFSDPDLFLDLDEIKVDINHYNGIQYFIKDGFTCNAFYSYNRGTKESYSLQVDLIKTFDDGYYTAIRFEDARSLSKLKSIMVSMEIHNPDIPEGLGCNARNNTDEDLYNIVSIIEQLNHDFPDPDNPANNLLN